MQMAQLNIVSVTVTELLIRFSWPMVTLFSAAINGTVCYSFFILQPGYCPLYFYVLIINMTLQLFLSAI